MDREIKAKLVDVSNKEWTFTSLNALQKFIKDEVDYWESQHDDFKATETEIHPYIATHVPFLGVLELIEGWNEEHFNDKDLNDRLDSELPKWTGSWLWKGHPYTPLFIKCCKEYGLIAGETFIKFVIGNNNIQISDREHLTGAILAYEFLNQESDITKRSESERVSLEELRDDLDRKKTELVTEVEKFKNNFKEWDQQTKINWGTWKRDITEEFTAQHEGLIEKFTDILAKKEKALNTLEETYREKLRLEGPADYWGKRAKSFEFQATRWTKFLAASLLMGLGLAPGLYWLKKIMGLGNYEAIAISVVVITIYAFLVVVIYRLAFSAQHLMRDAEEREQLTYLYLALTKEKEGGDISEESRNIVLQALFSRSETGLLTREAGPAMPGLGEMIKAIANSRK